MSNANRNMLGAVVHAFDHFGCHMPWASCGKPVRHASTARAAVTCKRCLASLAKRDWHFRARARAGLQRVQWLAEAYGQIRGGLSDMRLACDAARAIAAEEGHSEPNQWNVIQLARFMADTNVDPAIAAEQGRP